MTLQNMIHSLINISTVAHLCSSNRVRQSAFWDLSSSSWPGLPFASYCVWLGLSVLFCFCLFRVSTNLRGLHWLLSSFLSCIVSLLACNCPLCLLFFSSCRWQMRLVPSSSLSKLTAGALCIFLTPQYLAVFSTYSLNEYGVPLRYALQDHWKNCHSILTDLTSSPLLPKVWQRVAFTIYVIKTNFFFFRER